MYREIIAVCSEIHTKHTRTLCGQSVQLLNVKPGGTHSNHWAFNRLNEAVMSCLRISSRNCVKTQKKTLSEDLVVSQLV